MTPWLLALFLLLVPSHGWALPGPTTTPAPTKIDGSYSKKLRLAFDTPGLTLPLRFSRDETCGRPPSLTCPASKGRLESNGGTAGVNGCGAQGGWQAVFTPYLNWLAPQFRECCDNHDRCFSQCDSTFDGCNIGMANCMLARCDSLPTSVKKAMCDHAFGIENLVGKTCRDKPVEYCRQMAAVYYDGAASLSVRLLNCSV